MTEKFICIEEELESISAFTNRDTAIHYYYIYKDARKNYEVSRNEEIDFKMIESEYRGNNEWTIIPTVKRFYPPETLNIISTI